MTELRGSHARWSAAALVAPTAAALFTGVTAWTLHHPPAATSSTAASPPSTSAPPAAGPAAGSALVALRGSVRHDAAQVARLQKALSALRKQAAARTSAASAGSGTVPAGGTTGAVGVPVTQPLPVTQSGTSGGASTSYAAAAPGGQPAAAYVPPPAAAAQPVTPGQVPALPPVVQPAPAPPAHTTTGASGVPK